ncbi:MAG: methylmalonyl-CoA epimerase [Planctomycetes bacterium]|nr:methylmalonyl-CoA epimerase [Planctomycetota bacterium]
MPPLLDHLGVAVKNLDDAVARFTTLFGRGPDHRETVAHQKVEAAFFRLGGARVELIAPTAADSPISKFLEKRGEGLHHICLLVGDVAARLAELKAAGFALIDEVPRPGADNKMVAFLHPKSTGGVLIELAQEMKQPSLRQSPDADD